MKNLLCFLSGLIAYGCAAQCPYPVALTSGTGTCIGATLKVGASHPLAVIAWYKDGVQVAVDSATMQWSATGTVVAGGNGAGQGLDQLEYPWAIFVDDDGNVYVADVYRVVKWARGATSGVVVAGNNGGGDNADQVGQAAGVYADKAGNVYVLDLYNNRVTRWAPGASSGVTVAGGNGLGAGANQFYYPEGFYVDCDGNIYVADQYNSRIQLWTPGAVTGITVAGGSVAGNNANQLFDPYGVFVDSAKNIYISEVNSGKVIKWPSGAGAGTTVISPGHGEDTISLGQGLYGGADGTLYITDNLGSANYQSRVLEWAPGATTGTPVIAYGSKKSTSSVSGPSAVFVDHYGNLYVADDENYWVQEFPMQSGISNSYIAATPGVYYAIVTDMNGVKVTTNSLNIHLPPAVAPSISISATATDVDICQSVDFTAMTVNAGTDPVYQWQVSGVNAGIDSPGYSNTIFANGDQIICILHSDSSCQTGDTSNAIILHVDPQGHATVTITDSPVAVCAGVPEDFVATVINGSATPIFQWLVNGVPTSAGGDLYRTDTLTSGDVVYCLITSDASCGLAKSNSIPVAVGTVPAVTAGQVFTIPYGQSLELNPTVSGDISSYDWTPGTGLSDSTIVDPVADPMYTTTYLLEVTSPGGCKASGEITVDIYTPLSIPNAFTPNGDGRNDVLYVLGGPEGSRIKDFTIFDRWGQAVFRSGGGMPGDAAAGWDGRYRGMPAPAGAYVYEVVMGYANGKQQVYKGTVVLVR